jgi:hypothetical protein
MKLRSKDPYKFITINKYVIIIAILSLLTAFLGIYSVIVSIVAKDQAGVIRGYETEITECK